MRWGEKSNRVFKLRNALVPIFVNECKRKGAPASWSIFFMLKPPRPHLTTTTSDKQELVKGK